MKRTWNLLVPGCALWLALCAPRVGAAALDATRVTLSNGLRVVLAPDPNALSVDAALWFPSGTRHERPAQAGLAVLSARLGFRNGSDDPLGPLTAQGGSGSLSTTPDLTSFAATVPVEALTTALDFLAERLPGAPVTAKQLAAERAAIRGERSRQDRTPVARALARLWSAAWPGHPYAQTGGAPSAGSDALTPADVASWRRTRCAPGVTVLTLAGAFDADSALAQIRARFERLPRGVPARERGSGAASSAPPDPRAGSRATERIEASARLCLVGWRGPGAGDPDAAAFELFAAWLGGGPQARLARTLVRDWKLAVTAQAGYSAQRDGSLLWALAVLRPGADSAAVERALLDTVTGVTSSAPEAFELERARRQVEAGSGFALQTSRGRSQALGEAEMLAGDASAAARRLAALDKVSPDDVRRAAARILTEPGRATVWVLPSATAGAR